MKRLLPIIMVAALNFACSTTREQRCATYTEAYAAYLVILQVREPSQDEIAAAQAAALFLNLYCGWTNAVPQVANAIGPAHSKVPLLMPPK